MDINEPKKSQAGSKVRTFFRVVVISLLMLLIGLIVGFVISDKVAIDIKINNSKNNLTSSDSTNNTVEENNNNNVVENKNNNNNVVNENNNKIIDNKENNTNTNITKNTDLFSKEVFLKNWETEQQTTEIKLLENGTFIMDNYTISSEVKGTYTLSQNYIDFKTESGKTFKGIMLIENGEHFLSVTIDGHELKLYDLKNHTPLEIN